jgi:hypothetical protein
MQMGTFSQRNCLPQLIQPVLANTHLSGIYVLDLYQRKSLPDFFIRIVFESLVNGMLTTVITGMLQCPCQIKNFIRNLLKKEKRLALRQSLLRY